MPKMRSVACGLFSKEKSPRRRPHPHPAVSRPVLQSVVAYITLVLKLGAQLLSSGMPSRSLVRGYRCRCCCRYINIDIDIGLDVNSSFAILDSRLSIPPFPFPSTDIRALQLHLKLFSPDAYKSSRQTLVHPLLRIMSSANNKPCKS